ncbi:MAG: YebC/PmpR family DNA-binding transcriptional regulator [Planctomycetes bacterium]|nr:YebC/PmpR family DNA-binding transcriptional regulator [Planctomycetota bacterium]
MAGHSHSANIKFRKDRVDSLRGKLFSKMAKEIISAAREGGGDPSMNLRLRYAIDRAKKCSMPRDNIERAVKKGTGELAGESLEEVLYEGYAVAGVAVLVEALTDNRNRTAPDLRHMFEKRGGNLGTSGSVGFLFERHGIFLIPQDDAPSEDDLMEIVLEIEAEDLQRDGDAFEIRTAAADFHKVAQALEAKQLPISEMRLAWIPSNTVEVTDRAQAEKVLQLISDLEDHDDVQAVSANYEIPDQLLAEIESGS